VCGPSGSGKSTLINDILYRHAGGFIEILGADLDEAGIVRIGIKAFGVRLKLLEQFAQGGINAAVNTKGEGDSPWQHFDDTPAIIGHAATKAEPFVQLLPL
jgi:ABC-type dipeptide/oligopeptide/nickel transport system ATPase subunit